MHLVSWVGGNDLKNMKGSLSESGPIAKVIDQLDINKINLLVNYSTKETNAYKNWLRTIFN